jgi:hypothetical protein
VEQAEFQDNGKGSTPGMDRYYYQILAEDYSNVQLKEVQIYEGQHSGGVWVWGGSTVKLEGGSIHGHGREAINVGDGWDSGLRILKWWSSGLGFLRMLSKGAQVIVRDWHSGNGGRLHSGQPPWRGSRRDGGTLILKRCQVHNNKAYNLRIEGNGRVEFIDMPPVED